MAALATEADLEARLGRSLSGDELTQAIALLDDASATVRVYTGRNFEEAEVTQRLRVVDGKVRLPQSPVTAVASVESVDGAAVDFTWHHGGTVFLNGGVLNAWDYEGRSRTPAYVDVTYTAGTATIPEAIVAVVCSIAKRALEVPAASSGLTSESIGSYSYAIGPVAASGGAGLLNAEKAILDRFTRVGGTAWMGGR